MKNVRKHMICLMRAAKKYIAPKVPAAYKGCPDSITTKYSVDITSSPKINYFQILSKKKY